MKGHPQTKVRLLDQEIDQLARVRCSRPSRATAQNGGVDEVSVYEAHGQEPCAIQSRRLQWFEKRGWGLRGQRGDAGSGRLTNHVLALLIPAVLASQKTGATSPDVSAASRRSGIGDGRNDVSVTQAADIVQPPGEVPALDGRNSYRHSAKLAQFVTHRGLPISVMQAGFSSTFYFAPIALYRGWLMVGYVTIYTMALVFSLSYPELYKELTKGRAPRALSYKTFEIWLMISVYYGPRSVLFENEFMNIVAISSTALILNELSTLALEITIWSSPSVSMPLAWSSSPNYFDLSFIVSMRFGWKVATIVAMSALPLWIIKLIMGRIAPEATTKR
ncbi:hypothetical protein BC826DRAFT_972568 [Russula brevipes]|nr:hypothetical protein BC826DRAFT_972568 [Russula brevipes]